LLALVACHLAARLLALHARQPLYCAASTALALSWRSRLFAAPLRRPPPRPPQAPWLSALRSFRVTVDAFGRSMPMEEQLTLIQQLDFIPFEVSGCDAV
jgi:hypothetical protein